MSTLAAQRLGFGYRGHQVGADVDLALCPGEVCCLLGPNGCGKTTLFKTLLGLLPAQQGRVVLDGRDIRRVSRTAIARAIAYVPQAHEAVFPYSVIDMVLMGRSAHRGLFAAPTHADRRQALSALQDLDIAHLADRDYTRISGGQRQMVLIARALAQQTSLIVMDEPTASLDFGNQLRVLAEVQRLAGKGIGIVLSTHNPDHALRVAQRVLLMKEGSVIATGTPHSALTSKTLSQVYDVPIELATLGDGTRIAVPQQRR